MKNFLVRRFNTLLEHRNLSLLVILGTAILAFLNIYPNEFVLDDNDFIVDWPLIQSLANFPQFFVGYEPPPGQGGIYSPLKTFFHALNYQAFGLAPLGYHIVSVAVHLAAVVFVYLIIARLTNDRFIPFVATLLFAVHPVHIEYVTYLTGSVDAVGILFLFVAFYFYIRSRQERNCVSIYYITAVIFSILAVFTHELAISIPLLILWYDFVFYRKGGLWPIVQRSLPFFVIVLLYVLCKLLVLGALNRGEYIYGSFYLTMLVMVKAFAKYVYICFWPATLTHNHMIAPGISSFDPADFEKFAVLSQSLVDPQTFLALAALGMIFYFTFTNLDRRPLLAFCTGWFFISLLPGANIIPSGVYFAERYLYPGSMAFCLLAAYYLRYLFAREKPIAGMNPSVLTVVLILGITLALSVRTWIRNRDWKNEITLFESAIRANPQSALMHNDLGLIYKKNGYYDKALWALNKALDLRTDDPVTYFSLASTYMDMRRYKDAIEYLNKAIELDPQYADAYYNIAGIHAFLGLLDKSNVYLEKAMALYEAQGRGEEAAVYRKAFFDYIHSLRAGKAAP